MHISYHSYLTIFDYSQGRVLLNLKTSQPFEDVLVDLGQIIKVKNAAKMYTTWGQEVSAIDVTSRCLSFLA